MQCGQNLFRALEPAPVDPYVTAQGRISGQSPVNYLGGASGEELQGRDICLLKRIPVGNQHFESRNLAALAFLGMGGPRVLGMATEPSADSGCAICSSTCDCWVAIHGEARKSAFAPPTYF